MSEDAQKLNAELQVGQFVAPREVPEYDADTDKLPAQEEFFRPPVRFGSVPVEEKPLGFDSKKGYKKLFPPILLPTQVVERVSFGHPELEPNRLFWGDNLHVMRSLPSESIDLIYIDPPFFSGRNYNVIFGDKNELRSFSDIWEGGLSGYLIWLNARLVEMKRLLKRNGLIYVHLDWHSVHYVKVEMDKIFGHGGLSGKEPGFKNEIIWHYSWGVRTDKRWNRKHDTLLMYSKSKEFYFDANSVLEDRQISEGTAKRLEYAGALIRDANKRGDSELALPTDVWYIATINGMAKERIGYPTQKPESLLEKVVKSSCPPGGVVADFFVGGGTTVAVAESLGRRWVACDQSRVAVAITADRVATIAEQPELGSRTPDFTVEHWGVYEKDRLAQTPPDGFREFVLRAYGAVPDREELGVHGRKGSVPVWVGEPSLKSQVTAEHVVSFANAIKKSLRYQQDNLREGIMLAWSFRPDALQAAQELREREQTNLDFIRLEQVRIDSPQFREHITALTTDHADYENFLTFVQPPKVELGYKKLHGRTFLFDVSETALMNAGAKVINVQWDFDYNNRFTSTHGYSFVRGASGAPAMQAEFTFDSPGKKTIAVKVQDDLGGEGIHIEELDVD